MVTRVVYDPLALVTARETAGSCFLLLLFLLILTVALFKSDSPVNSIMIRTGQVIGQTSADLRMQTSKETIPLLFIRVDIVGGILAQVVELTHILHHCGFLLLQG